MNEQKWFLDSTTVRGALLTVFPTLVAVLKLFNIEIGTDEVNIIVNGLAGLSGLAGVIMAIIGRFKANSTLTVK